MDCLQHSQHYCQLTMEVQVAFLEAFLRGFPDLASLHLAESVGVAASVVSSWACQRILNTDAVKLKSIYLKF